ncbi:CRISPR-associated protein, Cas1 family [Seinonella peptonophila]|uniref:CRISPR-associated endonuclease Cas1 n=1 Tax=Seinonella peptonophila TaxID=112248 RepID=A0A1M5B4Q5_9BACL|nr:CRISPR-associated endonuclease Cas1 [Seinonella peptonophila]SHF37531.1 CRISPR-associated protein, Cas1 family [Seinonella peptonophila]
MGTFYLTEPYCFVRKESERLKVYKGKNCLKEIRVKDYARFFINEDSTLSTGALSLLAEKGIDVVYFSGSEVVGRFIGKENKNVRLRIAQVEVHLDEEKSLAIARNFVLAKIKNTRTIVQRFARRKKLDLSKTDLALKQLMKKCIQVKDIDSLRGMEGRAARVYFETFPQFIESSGFVFTGRSRRPAKDEVNALLNYGYALLRAELTGALSAAGLDPYIGFLHRERYGRESLSLDLMEEFRCVLVDNLITRIVNKKIIKPSDFIRDQGGFRLKDHARKRFLLEFDQRRIDKVKHEFLGRQMSYREILHKQAILLAKYIKGEMEDYYPFLIK